MNCYWHYDCFSVKAELTKRKQKKKEKNECETPYGFTKHGA
jgi:hypothetical protein